jgi:hypothetical protein
MQALEHLQRIKKADGMNKLFITMYNNSMAGFSSAGVKTKAHQCLETAFVSAIKLLASSTAGTRNTSGDRSC